jgi:hypothetical protein
MTVRQEYARLRHRAIARHPGQSGQAAAPAHTGPAGACHRRPGAARAAGSLSAGLLPQVAALSRFLWVSCG